MCLDDFNDLQPGEIRALNLPLTDEVFHGFKVNYYLSDYKQSVSSCEDDVGFIIWTADATTFRQGSKTF